MRKQKMPRPAPQAMPKTARISPMAAINLRSSKNSSSIAYPIAPPILPRGVVPKGVSMAMDASLYDYMTPLAAGQSYTGFAGYPHLSGLAARSEYRAFASALSSEMVRKWIKFTSSETDGEETKERIKQIEKEFSRLHVKELFARLVSDDALFGRAQLFLDVQCEDRANPLIISPVTIGKGALNGLTCIEPMWTTPAEYNSTDPSRNDFFKPRKWYMLGQEVHASRLLTVITRPMPDILKPAFNFSGISLSQLAEPYVNNWLRTRQSVSDLINNFSITVLATSMDSILQGDDDGQGLNTRLDVFAATRTNRGVLALDKEREELVQVNTPLGGLHELQAQSQEQMCAVSRMPSVVLTGISPNGMNASSEGELKAWYDWIAAQQAAHLDEPLKKVLQIVQLSLFGEIDDDIHFEWQPLQQMDAAQESTIRKTDCDTAMAYINGGVISPEEERDRLARDKKSLYQGLDLKAEFQPSQEDSDPENEPPEDDPQGMAHDADKWITVHPNGKGNGGGTPALIGEGGIVKGGMGGKFNGLNIKDAHGTKEFTSGETNAETAARHEGENLVQAPKASKPTDTEAANESQQASKSASERYDDLIKEYEGELKKIANLKNYDKLQNEGYSGGYSAHSDAMDDLYNKYKASLNQAEEEKFVEEWTPEVLESRRAEWNEAIKNNPPKTTREKTSLEKKLGYTLGDIKKAKELATTSPKREYTPEHRAAQKAEQTAVNALPQHAIEHHAKEQGISTEQAKKDLLLEANQNAAKSAETVARQESGEAQSKSSNELSDLDKNEVAEHLTKTRNITIEKAHELIKKGIESPEGLAKLKEGLGKLREQKNTESDLEKKRIVPTNASEEAGKINHKSLLWEKHDDYKDARIRANFSGGGTGSQESINLRVNKDGSWEMTLPYGSGLKASGNSGGESEAMKHLPDFVSKTIGTEKANDKSYKRELLSLSPVEGGLLYDYKTGKASKSSDIPNSMHRDFTTATAVKKAQAVSAKTTGATILNVPYANKDEVKAHGARWSPDLKKWYIPEGKEIHESIRKYAMDEADYLTGIAMDSVEYSDIEIEILNAEHEIDNGIA